MVENLVIVFGDGYLDIIKQKIFKNNTLVVCENSKIKEDLQKWNLTCRLINEYSLSDDQKIKPHKWIKEWANKKIYNEKNIKELLEYEGTSLYPYLESRLYHKRIHKV